jgi:hypothetical protein
MWATRRFEWATRSEWATRREHGGAGGAGGIAGCGKGTAAAGIGAGPRKLSSIFCTILDISDGMLCDSAGARFQCDLPGLFS